MKVARGCLQDEDKQQQEDDRLSQVDKEADAALQAALAAMESGDVAEEKTSTMQIMLAAAKDEEVHSADPLENSVGAKTCQDIENTMAAMDSFPEFSIDSDNEEEDPLDDDYDASFSSTMDAEALQREMELLEEMEKLDNQEKHLEEEFEVLQSDLSSQNEDLQRILDEESDLQRLINEKLAALAEIGDEEEKECKD